MRHHRRRLPGSFQDELDRVIERIAPDTKPAPVKPHQRDDRPATDASEPNARLFEQAWRKQR